MQRSPLRKAKKLPNTSTILSGRDCAGTFQNSMREGGKLRGSREGNNLPLMIIFMAVLLHYAANSRDAVKATEREVKAMSQVLVQSSFLPPTPNPMRSLRVISHCGKTMELHLPLSQNFFFFFVCVKLSSGRSNCKETFQYLQSSFSL